MEIDTKEHHNSECDIFIAILDINDHDPVFERTEYIFNISENRPDGEFIQKINVRKRDFILNLFEQ